MSSLHDILIAWHVASYHVLTHISYKNSFAYFGCLSIAGKKGVQGAQLEQTFDWMQRVRITIDAIRGVIIFT